MVNFGARIVSGVRKYDHISPTLAALGWCGVRELVARRDSIGVYRALKKPKRPRSSPLTVYHTHCRFSAHYPVDGGRRST